MSAKRPSTKLAKKRTSGLPSTSSVPTVGMSASGAQQAITVSALIVIGVYTYRRLIEPDTSTADSKGHTSIARLAGNGPPVEIGAFITAWGTAFLVISVLAAASPALGGSFALLIATGDLLNNIQPLTKDINTKVSSNANSGSSANGHVSTAATEPARQGAGGLQSSHDTHRSQAGL